jgi:hypothetical protein
LIPRLERLKQGRMSDAAQTPDAAGEKKRSVVMIALGALVAGCAGSLTVLQTSEKALELLGLKRSDAFLLAEHSARGELSRQVTRLISQRIFWTIRYSGAVEYGFPREVQEEAWRRYNEAVITWNENYYVSSVLAQKYSGPELKQRLEAMNGVLGGINACLNRIHYRPSYVAKGGETAAACRFEGVTGGTQEENLTVLGGEVRRASGLFGELLAFLSK